MRYSVAITALASISGALAHRKNAHPPSAKQVRVYSDLQQAAYHCAPAVAAYTAERKRVFNQHVLGSIPDANKLTADGLFPTEGEGSYGEETNRKLLSCSEAEEITIRNNTCVLTPEVTTGPYYERLEHPIRQNIAEYQPGLLTLYNIGVIDVETCEPVPNVLVDIWQANATGHYSGHPEPAPELKNEEPAKTGKRRGLLSPFPKTKFGETFGRGAWPTDRNGVASFTTIFPGYYTGRATHVHVKVYPEWEMHPNTSFTGSRLVHIGQFFFEDDLNEAVDKLWPYNTNPIADIRGRTRNWDDSLNIFEDSRVGGYKSTFETYLLGGVLQQGVVGYITMALNMSATIPDAWMNTGLD